MMLSGKKQSSDAPPNSSFWRSSEEIWQGETCQGYAETQGWSWNELPAPGL